MLYSLICFVFVNSISKQKINLKLINQKAISLLITRHNKKLELKWVKSGVESGAKIAKSWTKSWNYNFDSEFQFNIDFFREHHQIYRYDV